MDTMLIVNTWGTDKYHHGFQCYLLVYCSVVMVCMWNHIPLSMHYSSSS